RNKDQLKIDLMKVYKTLLFAALSAILITSCSKTGVQPITAKQTSNSSTSISGTTANTTTQGGDTVYAYRPNNSGAMGAVLPDSVLAGNWMLVSDSTSITHGESTAFNSGAKYAGQPGDFFYITDQGKIQMNEGTNYQTMDCLLTNSLTNSFELWYTKYPNVYVSGNGFIRAQLLPPVVSAHSATLTTQIMGTAGIYTRQFVLKR
ncbi:MAG TPA: hypothetical protein VHS53_17630, partial [Mucilaginibacter sp.]|nr:hypothetical protein [Mucilaginibacter sp.]